MMNKNQVNPRKEGRKYMVPVLFQAGTNSTIFQLITNDRIENIKEISLKEYAFTIDLPVSPVPPMLFINCSPFLFNQNSNYNSIFTDSIPITLHNPYLTPLGSYRFSFTYPLKYSISKSRLGQSKQWPQVITFSVINALNGAAVTLSEPSSLLFEVTTWEKSIEVISQEKNAISRTYYAE